MNIFESLCKYFAYIKLGFQLILMILLLTNCYTINNNKENTKSSNLEQLTLVNESNLLFNLKDNTFSKSEELNSMKKFDPVFNSSFYNAKYKNQPDEIEVIFKTSSPIVYRFLNNGYCVSKLYLKKSELK